MQTIIVPVINLSAIATKIFMKKEMKQYFFGNSIHQVVPIVVPIVSIVPIAPIVPIVPTVNNIE